MFFKGKRILIIGGTGTIGARLVTELLKQEPEVVRLFSRDEHKQFLLSEELRQFENVRFLIGDVRDPERVHRAMEEIEIVFHAAAMKHVPACEYNPAEAVKTNVLGTQNVIDAAIVHQVARVVLTSSDKSISPTNAMGATKLLAERLITAADYYRGRARTIFSAVRFGNVMGSRGSVIPFFVNQILTKQELTLTRPEMTRFMMSIAAAVSLTMKAAEVATGGEIFVLKMPVVRLADLVEVVVELTCAKYQLDPERVRLKEIGLRPGEKMYEELMTVEEATVAYELEQMYAVTNPFNAEKYAREYQQIPKVKVQSYTSEEQLPITKTALREMILAENLI